MVFSVFGAGIIVQKAKESLNFPTLNSDLASIISCYLPLKDLIKRTEAQSFTIQMAIAEASQINIGSDPCNINEYFNLRINQNDLALIPKMCNNDISPADYEKLLNCQSTSASVERSFSMLNKLLEKDRNFKPDNIKFYICLMYNKSN